MKEKIPTLIVLLILGSIIVSNIHDRNQYYQTNDTLNLMNFQQVVVFKIYPQVSRPKGIPIEFKTSEPIIADFWEALKDRRAYSINHDTVAYREQTWFLEIYAKGIEKLLQIRFYIPSNGNIVVGEFGKFGDQQVSSDGYFQSRKLLQWYQKYKARWLQSAPSPQPTATSM
jgi:hypothetical protein